LLVTPTGWYCPVVVVASALILDISIVVLLDIAVICPLLLTVIIGIYVELP